MTTPPTRPTTTDALLDAIPESHRMWSSTNATDIARLSLLSHKGIRDVLVHPDNYTGPRDAPTEPLATAAFTLGKAAALVGIRSVYADQQNADATTTPTVILLAAPDAALCVYPGHPLFAPDKSATTATATIYLAQGLMEADTAKRLIRAVEGTGPSGEAFPLILEGSSTGTGWTVYTTGTTQAPPTWETGDPLATDAAARRVVTRVQEALEDPGCKARPRDHAPATLAQS